MNIVRTTCGIVLFAAILACAKPPLFPKDVMRGVDTNFDFNAWRVASASMTGRKVQIGGRILEGQSGGEGILIVGRQLPIVERPAYGPSASQRKPGVGAYEFAVSYPGEIESSALSNGNRFIAIGITQLPKPVTVDGATRIDPVLLAQCVHIWKTRGGDIADFQSAGAGYQALEEATYCTDRGTTRPSPENSREFITSDVTR